MFEFNWPQLREGFQTKPDQPQVGLAAWSKRLLFHLGVAGSARSHKNL